MKNKIITIENLENFLKKIKSEGKKIVTTNGSFDILHIIHINILEKAKALGDVLIVLLNSDESIKRLKGEKRPIIPENERAIILSSLEFVDYVVIFNEDKPLNYLKKIKPDFHVKGGTGVEERYKEEKEFIENLGGEYKVFELEAGFSSTNIINKILDIYNK